MSTRPLKKADVQKLLSIRDKRDKLFFTVSLYCGRRVQETVNMTWGFLFDPRGPKIYIPKQDKYLYSPKHPYLIKTLEECYEGQDMDSYFMVARRGGGRPMSTTGVNDMIEKYFNEFGIVTRQNTSHCLRKTFARMFYEDNKDKHGELRCIRFLQKYLGHRSMDQTVDYLGLLEEYLAESVSNINYFS